MIVIHWFLCCTCFRKLFLCHDGCLSKYAPSHAWHTTWTLIAQVFSEIQGKVSQSVPRGFGQHLDEDVYENIENVRTCWQIETNTLYIRMFDDFCVTVHSLQHLRAFHCLLSCFAWHLDGWSKVHPQRARATSRGRQGCSCVVIILLVLGSRWIKGCRHDGLKMSQTSW